MKKYIVYASLTMGALFTGCDDFGDLNESPNATEVPLTSALLTSSLTQIGTSVTGGAAFTSGLYAQYFSLTQYTEASLYSEQDASWNADLAGPIEDLQNIIDINTNPQTAPLAALQGSNKNQLAIARILKAYRYSVLTDRYGDMPYFDALKQNTQPVFNTQQEIYEDIFKELDEAVEQFDGDDVFKGDILFNGDSTKWQKFANSWRLILALRVSDVNEELGRLQFRDALTSTGGVISDTTQIAALTYPGGAYKNPWFNIGADQGVSKVIADYLNAQGDNRRFAFGKPGGTGSLLGVPYGLKREDAIKFTTLNTGWSLIMSDNYRKETSTMFILKYSDVLLARAEALQRGWTTDLETTETVETLYEKAIQMSWLEWDIKGELYDAGDYTDYISHADIDITTGNPLTKIAFQRFINFYPNGPQGWSEWRRTGVPALTPTPNAVNTSKQIPRRFKYPSGEYGYNPVNIADAVSRLENGDNDNSRVWWDK